MKYRKLGKTNYKVSEISLGTWQLGGKWGEPFNKDVALETLQAACNSGINFFDTADVYQNGLSEKTIGEFIKTTKDKIYVVTKCGRKLNPHNTEGYNADNIIKFIDDSLSNMQLDSLDLVLLHCPPTDVFYKPEVFQCLDELKRKGKIFHYGVSVERIEEAIKALDYDISAVEIIFNMFRIKPRELFFKLAKEKNVGIIVRVPLASGLLTGKYTNKTLFGPNDHRTTNRNGERFSKGETFSGVDYETGIKAVDELKKTFGDNIAGYALKWVLMHDAVSSVIPGASSPHQIISNVAASDIKDFSNEELKIVDNIYEKYIKNPTHYLW